MYTHYVPVQPPPMAYRPTIPVPFVAPMMPSYASASHNTAFDQQYNTYDYPEFDHKPLIDDDDEEEEDSVWLFVITTLMHLSPG
jgi:hypothetical protein